MTLPFGGSQNGSSFTETDENIFTEPRLRSHKLVCDIRNVRATYTDATELTSEISIRATHNYLRSDLRSDWRPFCGNRSENLPEPK